MKVMDVLWTSQLEPEPRVKLGTDVEGGLIHVHAEPDFDAYGNILTLIDVDPDDARQLEQRQNVSEIIGKYIVQTQETSDARTLNSLIVKGRAIIGSESNGMTHVTPAHATESVMTEYPEPKTAPSIEWR